MNNQGSNTLFSTLAELMANAQADELQVKNQLLTSRERYVADKTASILETLQEQSQKTQHSMQMVNALVKEELTHLSNLEKEKYTKEFHTAVERLNLNKTQMEELLKDQKIVQADTWQDFLGFSEDTLLWLYQIGLRNYEQKRLEESHAIFRLLIMLNSLDCDCWIGLGFTQKSLLQPQEALNSFATAIILSPENPIARYQSATLYLELGQFDDALVELEILSEIIQKEKLDDFKSEVEVLLNKARNKQSL